MKNIDVIGLGHCCLDYLNVLGKYPDKGKKSEIIESATTAGGPVPTALAALSIWGKSTCLVGIVGDDPAGNQIIEELADDGVDVIRVEIDSRFRTPLAHIWIDPVDGARTIALDRTGMTDNPDLNVEAINFDSCRLFHSDARYTDSNLQALSIAMKMPVTTTLDCGALRPRLLEMLTMTDYAVVSSDLADTFAPGANPEQLADKVAKAVRGCAVVTKGADGLVWQCGSETGEMPGFPVKSYDTTGAGDVFHAGFIYGLLEEWQFEKCLQFAVISAALSTRKLSGRGGIPELEEVLSHLLI